MRQRCRIHQYRAGFLQRDRTRMQSRSGGQDVIDDDITYVWVDRHPVGDHERASDVLTAFLTTEARLREGLMSLAQEDLRAAPGDVLCEHGGDTLRLIIPAIEFAGGVQGDRYQHRPGEVAAKDIIGERRVGEVVRQERTAFVFDAMDDPTGGTAGAESADRPGEGGLEIEAVRAGPVTFEDAFEWVTAGQAARIGNAGELFGSGGREVQACAIIHRFLRDRAVPREDQVEEPAVELSQPAHRVRL